MAAPETAYPPPTKTGKIPFTPPGSEHEYVTSYRQWGVLGASVPLICLHGGPANPSLYMTPFSLVHQQFGITVVLYDQIGCGDSTRLPEKKGDTQFWTFDLFVNELRNLISHLDIKEYDLLGHSWGGMIAQTFALTQPLHLRKLILASAIPNVQRRVAVTMKQRALIPGLADIMEKCEAEGTTSSPEYRAANDTFRMHHICRLDPRPPTLAASEKIASEDRTVFATIYGGPTAPGPLGKFNVDAQLHEITDETAPGGVLITNGEYDTAQDEVIRPQFTNIRARVKWVKYTNSSHMPFYEEPEKFFADLGAFLLSE